VHVLAKPPRGHCQLVVAVVGDAVIEEDADATLVRAAA
jgi:hypothetical protein